MYKIGEVCRITGITRKDLQKYNALGLVKPSATNMGGHWLYDREAFKKILIIQMFAEVGFNSDSIKRILESDEADLAGAFDKVTVLLEEKRKRIDEMIDVIRHIQQEISETDITPENVANMNDEQRIKARSLFSAVGDAILTPKLISARRVETDNSAV